MLLRYQKIRRERKICAGVFTKNAPMETPDFTLYHNAKAPLLSMHRIDNSLLFSRQKGQCLWGFYQLAALSVLSRPPRRQRRP
jgi:hypothetical protein